MIFLQRKHLFIGYLMYDSSNKQTLSTHHAQGVEEALRIQRELIRYLPAVPDLAKGNSIGIPFGSNIFCLWYFSGIQERRSHQFAHKFTCGILSLTSHLLTLLFFKKNLKSSECIINITLVKFINKITELACLIGNFQLKHSRQHYLENIIYLIFTNLLTKGQFSYIFSVHYRVNFK